MTTMRVLPHYQQGIGAVSRIGLDRSRDEQSPKSLAPSLMETDTPDIGPTLTELNTIGRLSRQVAPDVEFNAFFNNPVICIYRSTPCGLMLRSNPALVTLNGYASEAELVAAVHDIETEWYVDPGRRGLFCRLMAEQGNVTDFVSEIYRHKTRERIWITETAWVVRDHDGHLACYAGTVAEITARRQAEELLKYRADHDPLTDLSNRCYLKQWLGEALASRQPRGGLIAILCLDLDLFKPINDRHGHAAGDVILIEVARRLAAECRTGDLVARLGGDEFCVVMMDLGKTAEAVQAAERLVRIVSVPYNLGDETVSIGISIGIACAPTDGLEANELLCKADFALYRAKHCGGKHVWVFDALKDQGLVACKLAGQPFGKN